MIGLPTKKPEEVNPLPRRIAPELIIDQTIARRSSREDQTSERQGLGADHIGGLESLAGIGHAAQDLLAVRNELLSDRLRGLTHVFDDREDVLEQVLLILFRQDDDGRGCGFRLWFGMPSVSGCTGYECQADKGKNVSLLYQVSLLCDVPTPLVLAYGIHLHSASVAAEAVSANSSYPASVCRRNSS